MKLLQPKSLDAALGMLANGETVTPLAGGTDLMVSWHHVVKEGLALMDLSGLTELREFRLSDRWLELGGLTTYWDVIRSDAVGAAFPLLVEAARQVGAVQIQTRGTWAGNIGNASPAADGVPVLMAYEAIVLLQSVNGTIEVPLDKYYTGYKQTVRARDQLITGIRIPRRSRRLEWFRKVGSRSAQTITKVGAAVVHDDAGWRVAANSVAPYVCRCRNFEESLNAGATFGSPKDVLGVIKKDISPITDSRSTAEYRSNILSRLLYWRLVRNAMD